MNKMTSRRLETRHESEVPANLKFVKTYYVYTVKSKPPFKVRLVEQNYQGPVID